MEEQAREDTEEEEDERRWVRLQKMALSRAPALHAALRTEGPGLASLLLLMGR